MNNFNPNQVENMFKKFAGKHFENPQSCRNSAQAEYFLDELNTKIEEYRERFNYVPKYAYSLMNGYINQCAELKIRH